MNHCEHTATSYEPPTSRLEWPVKTKYAILDNPGFVKKLKLKDIYF